MNNKMLLVLLALMLLLFGGCNKNHYDLSEVNGVNAEGEMLLPLASASYSLSDLMKKFQLDDLIFSDASGNLFLEHTYEYFDAVKGSDVLRFKDNSLEEHYSIENPFPFLPIQIDTSVRFTQAFTLESEHIRLLSAMIKSGVFAFDFASNMAQINRVVIGCYEIKDANGRPVEFVWEKNGTHEFDMSGLRFETETYNTLNLNCEVYFSVNGVLGPEITFDIALMITDLAVDEMSGWVEDYHSPNVIDTAYTLFSENLVGSLEINAVDVRFLTRSSFDMSAQLIIDTAFLSGPGMEPLSLFDEMPQVLDIKPSSEFEEVFHHVLHGRLNAHGGQGYAVTDFVLNPFGVTDLVTIREENTLDLLGQVRLPFEFKVDDVRYLDTVGMDISVFESPEWIENLTLELTVNSNLPFNLTGDFIMYDMENQCVIDTLANNLTLISSTFDGQMNSNTFSLVVDNEKVQSIMRSDSLILSFNLDTNGHDAVLNTNQILEVFLKARVKYNGIIE